MKRRLQTLVLVWLWGSTGPVLGEAFRAYATVVDVQPVVETRYEPVARRVCTDPDAAARAVSEVVATIGEDIRSQRRAWLAQRSCTTVTERQPRQRVTAYRVTYRYRGYTSTTLLSQHPGERMAVNVSLSPLPR